MYIYIYTYTSRYFHRQADAFWCLSQLMAEAQVRLCDKSADAVETSCSFV